MPRSNLPSTPVRIVHTSDTHLGDPHGHPVSEPALEKVINKVKSVNADFLILPGDIFDNQRVKDDVVSYFLTQINRLDVPTILLPGNHDLMDEQSIYKRKAFNNAPKNLHIFNNPEGQIISISNVDFWGKAMEEHSPEFKPISGMPKSTEGRWLVSLAHGHFEEDVRETGRSSLIFPNEIASLDCDYLALGHWDVHTDISQNGVTAIYSGCPMGIGGKIGTVTVVDLDKIHGVSYNQVSLN